MPSADLIHSADPSSAARGERGDRDKLDDQRRRQILAVAEKLFSTGRFHEITLDQVAQQAAVGKGTIYRHFADKEDLFFQVALCGFDDLCAVVSRKVEASGDFQCQLVQVCEEIGQFFDRRRTWFRLMQAEATRMLASKGKLRQRWLAQRAKLVKAVARVIESGRSQRRIRPDIAPAVLAHYLLGMLRTQAMELAEADSPALRGAKGLAGQRRKMVAELFLNGCAAK